MDNSIINLILQTKKIAYAITDQNMVVVETGGSLDILHNTPFHCQKSTMLDLVPELVGNEQVLFDILNGDLEAFKIDMINQKTADGCICYLSLDVIPITDEKRQAKGLLLLMEDVNDFGQQRQEISQERNELSLLKDAYRIKIEQLHNEIEEKKQANEYLEFLSRIDGLTGIANRRYFDEKLVQEYKRHSRSGLPLSIIMLDIDHFKLFNDSYGHLKGDECLRQVAQLIKTQVARSTDLVTRYGGEEFACILPETGASDAKTIARNIQLAVSNAAIYHIASQTGWLTISLGVITAKCQANGSPEDLIAMADQQLYIAKANGRNNICSTIQNC